MTYRGMFSHLNTLPGFRDSSKTLKISLLQSTQIWNSLLVEGDHGPSQRENISKMFESLKKAIEDFSDREFIYFIATRPRIRIAGKPRISFFGSNLVIKLAVGSTQEPKKIKIPLSALGNIELDGPICIDWKPSIIRFCQADGKKSVSIPIHTLLEMFNISLGIHSNITYVGRTNEPKRRVVDGNHRGLTDTLLLAQENNDDIFLFSNIFHGRHHGESQNGVIHFVISNSITDHIAIKPEAELIEKLFIYYFDPITQRKERKADISKLRNLMKSIFKDENVISTEVSYAMEIPNEYFKFGSEIIEPKSEHNFSVQISENDLKQEVW